MRPAFQINGVEVKPGERRLVELPVAKLSTHTPVSLPVHVLHGRHDGPTLFVSAAIHGDEVLGVEIIRRLLKNKSLKSLRGTLLCIPVVNIFGFLGHSRYLPDRRDLNRSFPGSTKGSLAAQLAHIFMTEVVARADFGIDLHTGAINRPNLPQLRANFNDETLRALAEAFGAPILLHAEVRQGSLREAALDVDTGVLLYEAGEALRLDELPIRIGVKGILRVMKKLDMLRSNRIAQSVVKSTFAKSSRWVRAADGGLFRSFCTVGDSVEKGAILGAIANPYEETETNIVASIKGIVIGRTTLPVVNRGEALYHIARVRVPDQAEENVGQIAEELGDDPIFDEDEVI